MKETIIDELIRLGFTKYEAQAYIALLRRNPLNGYELAKISGVPRPNIYSVLKKLENRGAVLSLETPNGTRYIPVEARELIERMQRDFQNSVETLTRGFEEISKPQEVDQVLNFQDYSTLLEHTQSLIAAAREKLLLALSPEEAEALVGPLKEASQRGVEIETICLSGCQNPCAFCQGKIHTKGFGPGRANRWMVSVRDDSEIIAGEILPNGHTTAVRTSQSLLVELATWYLRQNLALFFLLDAADGTVIQRLSPEGQHWFASLNFDKAGNQWGDLLHRLINQPVQLQETR